MIVVHHLENSRSQRVLWLLEELVVPYEVRRYERDKRTMLAPPELRAVHPLGKSPVITDGDVTVAETGAIIEYLLEEYGGGSLVPPDKAGRRALTYWLHYAEGSAMPPFLLKLVFTSLPRRSPGLMKPVVNGIVAKALDSFVEPQIKAQMSWWEGTLTKTRWFAGDTFSAADIMMSFPLEVAASRSSVEAYPHVRAFLQAIHARPAYQRALETGGPYGIIGSR